MGRGVAWGGCGMGGVWHEKSLLSLDKHAFVTIFCNHSL